MSSAEPSAIDLIPYDAPLTFPQPSQDWCNRRGGYKNNRTETLGTKDVPPVDLTGQWILLSGASSGIGKEAALTFASWGANLVLACREPTRTEEHPLKVVEQCIAAAKAAGHQSTVEWWAYDATSLASVEALGQRWLATGRPLDVLCNNAGVGSSPGGSCVVLTSDGFETIHQVNLLSHVLLTLMLLPALAKSKIARVICSTSCFHYLGTYDLNNFNGGPSDPGASGVNFYKNNKLYFQIWVAELQYRLLQHDEYKHITVNGLHPGYVASGIWYISKVGYFSWLVEFILFMLVRFFGIDSRQGSWAIVNAATTDLGEKQECRGGRYFNRIWEEDPMPHCRDRDARLRVWRKLNDELKLKERGLLDVLGLYSGEA